MTNLGVFFLVSMLALFVFGDLHDNVSAMLTATLFGSFAVGTMARKFWPRRGWKRFKSVTASDAQDTDYSDKGE